jgi:hypothetical protein
MLVCILEGKAAFSTSTATGYKNDLFHSKVPSNPNFSLERFCRISKKLSFRASPTPYRAQGRLVGRDPESREVADNQIILDTPPLLAGDDELEHSLLGGRQRGGLRKTPNRFLTRSGDIPVRLEEIT